MIRLAETQKYTVLLAAMKHYCRHLAGHCDELLVLVARGAIGWVIVVEHNADSCLGDACAALLVYKLLQVLGPHLQPKIALSMLLL